MPTLNQKGSPRFGEAGLAPIILIIIFVVAIIGAGGVAYNSRKEIQVRSDKTSESKEIKGSPVPTANNQAVALDQSGALASKPFEQKTDPKTADSEMPNFSIYPPAGWSKLPPDRQIVVEFTSPTEDKIEEGMAYLTVQPNITVFAMKEEYANLDEAIKAIDKNKTSSETVNSRQKGKINGEEVYIIEYVKDISDLSRNALESQIDQEITAAEKKGNVVSRTEVQKDIDKVLKQAKVKILSYSFYKNGYFFRVAGKAFDSYWDKRNLQIKRSLDSFKFSP